MNKLDFFLNREQVRLLFYHDKEEDFSKDNLKGFYNYCPSYFIEGNTAHIYYCTNKDENVIIDHIGYRTAKIVDNDVVFSDEQIVLDPTLGDWDDVHVCDPTVIKGVFKYNNEEYYYLMSYLGCVTLDCSKNETGIAVSKTPSGPWIKCSGNDINGHPINPIVPWNMFGCLPTSWGTGQSCLISLDNKSRVLLIVSITFPDGGDGKMQFMEYDFSNINEYRLLRSERISTKGMLVDTTPRIKNAEFALDYATNSIIMAAPKSPFGVDKKTPTFIADTIELYRLKVDSNENVIDALFSKNYHWEYLKTLRPQDTGFIRNHNVGLLTDEYGQVISSHIIGLAFTSSKEGIDYLPFSYLKTYRIHFISYDID